MNWSLKRTKRREVEIAIVNLVDVIFILLIFYVMTSTFDREKGLEVERPKSTTASALSAQSLVVGLDKLGQINFQDNPMDAAALSVTLAALQAGEPKPVVVVADRDAPNWAIVEVLDACNKAKVPKVSLSARLP
jgi:biopolymer transport protein ExbD